MTLILMGWRTATPRLGVFFKRLSRVTSLGNNTRGLRGIHSLRQGHGLFFQIDVNEPGIAGQRLQALRIFFAQPW
ncbi:hypothetical protein WH5701_00150, partial [Synechococcus sp. WH 5701]